MSPSTRRSGSKPSALNEAPISSFSSITKFQSEKPFAKLIPKSNKKHAISVMAKSDAFPILDLPDELRLKIYGFILPSKERIFLDPENFYRPLPYQRSSYGSTFNLLRVNKKIHYEATEFIFTNNTVNIIKPNKVGDFLHGLGDIACQFITTLECHMHRDLGDLGMIWATMNNCPKLEELRLVFYHDRQNWHHVATQLAFHVMKKEKPVFEIELYDSIWANSWYGYERETFFSLADAERHALTYSFSLPTPLKKIVLTASISPPITTHLLESNDGRHWQLQKVGSQQNGAINTLRWIGTEIGEDVELDESEGEQSW